MRPAYIIRECYYCGPRKVIYRSGRVANPDTIICPTCHLDPGEINSIEEVRSKGFERAYAEEIARGNPEEVSQPEVGRGKVGTPRYRSERKI